MTLLNSFEMPRTPLFRFILVGTSNTVIGYALFLAAEATLRILDPAPNSLISDTWRLRIAYCISYTAATFFAYYNHHRFTFQCTHNCKHTILAFALLQGTLAASGSALLGILTQLSPLPYYILWFPVTILSTATNYNISRRIFS